MPKYKLVPLEENTLLRYHEKNVKLEIDDESGYNGEHYFKFLNDVDYIKADKIARIKFEVGEYVFHHDGKIPWLLNTKEVKLLNSLLVARFKTNNPIFKPLMKWGLNVWQAGMFMYNYYQSDRKTPFEWFANLTRSTKGYDQVFIPIAEVTFPNYKDLLRYTKPGKLK